MSAPEKPDNPDTVELVTVDYDGEPDGPDVPMPQHHPGSLYPDQQRRAAALHEARSVLTSRGGMISSTAPDALDLVSVASWILDGKDPWAAPTSTTPQGPNLEYKGDNR